MSALECDIWFLFPSSIVGPGKGASPAGRIPLLLGKYEHIFYKYNKYKSLSLWLLRYILQQHNIPFQALDWGFLREPSCLLFQYFLLWNLLVASASRIIVFGLLESFISEPRDPPWDLAWFRFSLALGSLHVQSVVPRHDRASETNRTRPPSTVDEQQSPPSHLQNKRLFWESHQPSAMNS